MRVTASSAVLWALAGYEDGEGNTETEGAEVFAGVGFFARPKPGNRAEAVLLKVGGESGHTVAVATRDQDALAKAGIGDEDGAQIHNTVSIVRVRANGTVEVGAHGGPFVALATKADVEAIKTAFDSHTHVLTIAAASGSGATGTAAIPATPAPAPAGTTKLKAM